MKYKLLRYSLLSMLAMLCGNLFAQEPEVTLDFTTNDGWGFSTTKAIETQSYTNADGYTIKLTGSSGNGYRWYAEGYVINGKQGATLELPAFSFDVEKIEVVGRSGASSSTKQNIFVGDVAVSTETVGVQGTNTYDIAADYQAAGNVYVIKVTSNHNTQFTKILVYKKGSATPASVEAPAISPAAGTYYEPQTVTITTATDGATVYYSTDGTNFSAYTAPVTVSETTTISAYAQKGDEKSKTVTAKYVIAPNYTSIAKMLEDITATKTDVQYTFENLTVVYVAGSYNYVTDGTSDLLLYGANLGLTAGDKVNGTVKGQLYLYNKLPELAVSAANVSTTTVSSGNTVEAKTIEPDDLGSNLNKFVTIKNATYVSANGKTLTFKVGDNEFVVYNQFSIDVTALEADKAYDITGFGGCYNATLQLFPVLFTEAKAEEPAEEAQAIYSWEGKADGAVQTGGTATATDASGADLTDQDINTKNSSFYVIRLRGAKDFSTNVVVITLDKELKAGDEIAITAYRNKNDVDKKTGALLKFDKGSTTVSTAGEGLEFVNIDASDASADDKNRGTEPNTVKLTVPADADGSKVITMTRAITGTNLFITKLVITGERSGEEPVTEPVVAGFRPFAVDLRDANGGILTAEEAGESQTVSFGLTVDESGKVARVAADAQNTAAVITGKTGNNHGLQSFSATVPVEGAVKITMSTCSWGGEVTVKDAEGNTVATFNTKKGEGGSGCYKGNGLDDENIISTKYVGEATTLTVSGGAYVGFFAVEAIEASSVDVAYSLGDADCQGDILPVGGTYAAGDEYTIPAKNFTLYKEGYTLTGWTDGTDTYAAGQTITLSKSLTLTPVFTANEVSLNDRKDAVTVKFDFQRNNGAPTVAWQNTKGVWVAQAQVNGKTIDVKADIDTNNGGKLANANWGDWAQLNKGTAITIPSAKGAVVSVEAYNELGTGDSPLTIDGQSDYTQGKTISYTIQSSAANVDVLIGSEGAYYRYVQVVLPVVQQQGEGGEAYDNVAGSLKWTVGNEASATISDEIAKAVQNAVVSTGDELKVETAKYFDETLVKYTPNNSNAGNVDGVMIEYRVKLAAGLSFKPTSVSYDAVKVGTDGATFSWGYVVDETASEIATVDAATVLRNNGANSASAQLTHTLDLSAAGEGNVFALRFYISKTANNKNICIGNVIINGTVSGTAQNVTLYSFAATASPAEGGSVNVYPAADEYEAGTELTLTATKNFGYKFVNWTDQDGNVVSTDAKFVYTVNADAQLTANFEAVNTYELALTVDGTNDYMVRVSPAPTVVDGKNLYEEGTAVQLTATQYDGLVTFTNWNDGETGSEKLISINEDTQLTAYYAEADIIAGWDFYTAGGSGRKADFAAQDNDADALNLVNTATGETSGWLDKSTEAAGGYESFAGAAVNWRTGSANGDVGNWHWQTKINAEAFTDINVQFQMMYNYNSYQTYDVEYSTDGETWTKVGNITMTGAKSAAAFNDKLPAAANNQKDLYIRLIADKTSKVDGTASANDGNALAMLFITGTPKLVDDGKAPELVNSVPADGATGASASGKIVLTFDERVKVKEGTTAKLGALDLTPNVSGKTITFEYKGLEYDTDYKFVLAGNSVADLTDNYIDKDITINFATMSRPSVTKGLYDAVVENVDQLVAAINEANARADKNTRYRIFLKKGSYALPSGANKHYTHTNTSTGATLFDGDRPDPITYVNASNISFIGEDRDATIITQAAATETFAGQFGTASIYDGIGNSDVLQLASSVRGTYFQDVTVKSGIGDALGRNLAVQDKGSQTIYKNTVLYGYQDTWTSNNDNGYYYFEGGVVRGRTDFLCGKGDAFFNAVEIRMLKGGYIAVPSKSIKYGFTFKDCEINGDESGVDGNYTLGRPWGQGTPVALWIDTRMNVVPSAIGWNEMSGGWPSRFAEYNSTTSTGSVIDLSGRKKTFGDGHENNPVLSAEEALEAGNLHNMYGEWDPTLATEQAPAPQNVVIDAEAKKLAWDGSNYALLWAIVKDGKVVDFTTEPAYDVDDATAEWAVRAANEMGGLGEASKAVAGTVGIKTIEQQQTMPQTIYNLQGVRVEKAGKGLYIIGGKKVIK